jgi:hypothetical protein
VSSYGCVRPGNNKGTVRLRIGLAVKLARRKDPREDRSQHDH